VRCYRLLLQNGFLIRYVSNELKNDREFVLAAVNRDGSALQYASDELKNDREIVLLLLLIWMRMRFNTIKLGVLFNMLLMN
jgi:hypothetical protein